MKGLLVPAMWEGPPTLVFLIGIMAVILLGGSDGWNGGLMKLTGNVQLGFENAPDVCATRVLLD
jgi:hypothetical protein